MKMTMNAAASELDSIRNDRGGDVEALKKRVDSVGQWVAQQKTNKRVMKLLEECSQLHDKLEGGTGKGGVRIQFC